MMLSRTLFQTSYKIPLGMFAARYAASGASSSPAGNLEFRRIVRLEYPSKVRMGFIPDEWFTYFYKKSGVTGPYVFAASFLTFLCSKEIYIMEHEFYNGISLAAAIVLLVKKIGPFVAETLDKEIDQIETNFKTIRKEEIDGFDTAVKNEETEQWRAEGQLLLMEAKKENIALQLETAYRARLATVFAEVKRRLNYQVEFEMIQRRIQQKHMVNWVVGNVLKEITPENEQEHLNRCITDLVDLSTSIAAANTNVSGRKEEKSEE